MGTIENAHAEGTKGAARAASSVPDEWKEQALLTIIRIAMDKEDFHVDDIWDAGLPETNNNKAIGHVLKRAKSLGAIEKTDRMRSSIRSHGSEKPVWRSLIYDRSSS